MRITQGTSSHLPDLTDEQIKAQVQYCIDNGWAVSMEHTDDPHPRNIYWEMWGLPMSDRDHPSLRSSPRHECRTAFPTITSGSNGYDRTTGGPRRR